MGRRSILDQHVVWKKFGTSPRRHPRHPCVLGMGVRCTPWNKRHHHYVSGLRSRKIPPHRRLCRRNFANGRALIGWEPVKQPRESEIPDGLWSRQRDVSRGFRAKTRYLVAPNRNLLTILRCSIRVRILCKCSYEIYRSYHVLDVPQRLPSLNDPSVVDFRVTEANQSFDTYAPGHPGCLPHIPTKG